MHSHLCYAVFCAVFHGVMFHVLSSALCCLLCCLPCGVASCVVVVYNIFVSTLSWCVVHVYIVLVCCPCLHCPGMLSMSTLSWCVVHVYLVLVYYPCLHCPGVLSIFTLSMVCWRMWCACMCHLSVVLQAASETTTGHSACTCVHSAWIHLQRPLQYCITFLQHGMQQHIYNLKPIIACNKWTRYYLRKPHYLCGFVYICVGSSKKFLYT